MELKLKHYFDAAHRLGFHKGKCQNIHGHRWNVIVEIDTGEYNPEGDMIMDFGDIKELINDLDHTLILNGNDIIDTEIIDFFRQLKEDDIFYQKLIILKDYPTAENLSIFIKDKIIGILKKKGLDYKVSVKLFESPNASVKI